MPFFWAMTSPNVILGGLGSTDSSFSSRTHVATSCVASSEWEALSKRLNELRTPFSALESGHLVQARDEGLVDLRLQLGGAACVDTLVLSHGGMHVFSSLLEGRELTPTRSHKHSGQV
jgi:hypothetical protein